MTRNQFVSTTRLTTWSLAIALSGSAAVADTVVVATGKDFGGQMRVSGEVLDFNGQQLRLRAASGGESTIPTSRVLDIETTWTESHVEADRLFAERQFAEARSKYRVAIQDEQREWARRRILAQIVRADVATGDVESASVDFLQLAAADPTLQYFDAIPLAWNPYEPTASFERRAKAWLAGESAAGRLVAASWLLSTSQRGTATAALRQLTNDADPRLSQIATAQLWRTQLVTASVEELGRWEKQIDRIPAPLRAGPYYTLGRALARHDDQHERAALTLLRLPVLYPAERQLAADSLVAAGRELEQLSQRREAASLYREVIADYAESDILAEAIVRLKSITETP